jgi:hypothetical protein
MRESSGHAAPMEFFSAAEAEADKGMPPHLHLEEAAKCCEGNSVEFDALRAKCVHNRYDVHRALAKILELKEEIDKDMGKETDKKLSWAQEIGELRALARDIKRSMLDAADLVVEAGGKGEKSDYIHKTILAGRNGLSLADLLIPKLGVEQCRLKQAFPIPSKAPGSVELQKKAALRA